LPPGIDWSALPLANQLAVSLTDREGNQLSQSPISHVIRPGVEIVWTEPRWTDPTEHREARSRHLLARGSNIQTLISLTFWPEDAKRLEPAWQEILRSLRLGEYVSDPLRGPLGTIS
jgi:hypothetical protein